MVSAAYRTEQHKRRKEQVLGYLDADSKGDTCQTNVIQYNKLKLRKNKKYSQKYYLTIIYYSLIHYTI